VKIYNINLKTEITEKFFYLAIGNFDGVHIGHQEIISSLVEDAKKNNKPSAILSFQPHPRQYFSKELSKYQIIYEKEKQEILKKLKIDYYFLLNFDASIANLLAQEFIEKIIIKKLNISKLTVGYDFRFGKNRQGDINLLQDYSNIHGFALNIIDPIKDKKIKEVFSSTLIREFIRNGEIDKANTMLGRPWSMNGTIIYGDQQARKMNFPTANIIPSTCIHPLKGVYAVNILFDNQTYIGIANFGERPTLDGKKLLLEVHIFDFNEDIYGKHLTVEFLTFIREEKKFDSFSLLANQVEKDIQIVREYHLNK